MKIRSVCVIIFFSDDLQDEGIHYKAKEPILTLYCRIKISIRNILLERPFEVTSGIFLAFFTTLLIFQYNSKCMQRKSVRNYYLLICKILKEQVQATFNYIYFLIFRVRSIGATRPSRLLFLLISLETQFSSNPLLERKIYCGPKS